MSTLPNPHLDVFAAFAQHLADEARTLFAPAISLAPSVEVKSDRSLVTALDRAIEVRLRELIEHAYPHHGIYGEEEGHVRLDAEYVWVLDPIDGTAPFIAGRYKKLKVSGVHFLSPFDCAEISILPSARAT